MAGAWNGGSWGSGNFGDQNSITVQVTSVVDTPLAWSSGNFGSNYWSGYFPYIGISLGDETSAGEINSGWGRAAWSSGAWGISGTLLLNGNQLNIGIGGPANGWGELSWNNSDTQWGGITTASVAIGQQINITGLQLNTSLNSVSLDITADANPTGLQINISQGTVDAEPDAEVTGQQINTSLNSVTITAEINSGWGRLGWGIYDWGSDGLSTVISIDNTNLPLTINSGITEYWGQDVWGATTTEWGGSSITQVNIDAIAEVSSIINAGWGQVAWGTQNWGQGELNTNLTIAEGEVDPSPDVTVTGIGMTIDLAVGIVVIGTGNVTLTGEQLNISQGDVIGDANTIASITGIGLNIAVGTVFAGGTSIIEVTGNGLTIALNSINNQIWTEINTGTDATWIEVDTAA